MTMASIPEVIAVATPQIGREEGCRLTAYRDSRGIWTIGWGRADAGVTEGMTCTQAQADGWRDNKILQTADQLEFHLPWWRTIGAARAAVLLEMAYQMGAGGLLAFDHALAAMQAGQWSAAAADMLNSDWAEQTPARAKREADQMRTGVAV